MKIKSKANIIGTESLGTLGTRIIDTVYDSGIEEATTTKQFVELVDVNDIYHVSLEPANTKKESEKIDDLFDKRAKLFCGIFIYLQGSLNSPDIEMQTAAQKILEQFNKFGRNFSRIKIADQTLHYGSIITGLKQDEYQPALEKTLLTNKITLLSQLHSDYESLYRQRGNSVANNVAPTKIRKQMEKAVKLYLDEVRWMANQKGTEQWKTLSMNVEKRFSEINPSITKKEKTAQVDVNSK